MNTIKKGLRRKLSVYSPKLGEELGLFRLIIQRSNLDGGTPKSRWGTCPPYNLSTAFNHFASNMNITFKIANFLIHQEISLWISSFNPLTAAFFKSMIDKISLSHHWNKAALNWPSLLEGGTGDCGISLQISKKSIKSNQIFHYVRCNTPERVTS